MRGFIASNPLGLKQERVQVAVKRSLQKGTKGSDQGPQVLETNNFVVEPTIPGQVLNVVGDGLRSKGHHKAMSIVEDGAALDGGTRGGLKKGLKGVSNLKLQVRKQSVFKAPNLPLLSEWVNSLSCNVSVEKHSHVPVDSSSTQGDPPDTRSHTNNVHGIGLKVIWVISIWCRLGIWQPHLQCWDSSYSVRNGFNQMDAYSSNALAARVSYDEDILFGGILWTIWKTRNARLFSSDSSISDNVMERAMRLFDDTLRARLPERCNREGNQAAGLMARLAWRGTPEYHRYMDPPLDIRDILISDRANLHSVMA
ncbi:hypothetical protein V6N11_075082 [Hibiscus sabdariffa]|uniref:RNase H type-1 domain-containing protein n=1 Tax=Hibiscus sabdariffa TaxID=183260 RepID=A0ABR2R5S7_9ROSI